MNKTRSVQRDRVGTSREVRKRLNERGSSGRGDLPHCKGCGGYGSIKEWKQDKKAMAQRLEITVWAGSVPLVQKCAIAQLGDAKLLAPQ